VSEDKTVLQAQLDELLKLVENFRESSSKKIDEQARARADEIIAQARKDARAHMRAAIAQERARARDKITSTRARLLTQRRQRQQRIDRSLVAQGWVALGEALADRWRDAEQRRAWIAALVRQANSLLPASDWRVEHAPGWNPEEMLSIDRESSSSARAQAPTFVEDATIEAGVRIRVDGTCLDGTIGGLLANRAAVEAELLAEVYR